VNPASNQAKQRFNSAFTSGLEPFAVISLARDDELGFWTQHLNCSSEKLLAAVESVGPRVDHVTEYLRAGWW
jgi:hypothetical protein